MEIAGLIFDLIIVVLLCWTIMVASKLSKNLIIFNKSKKELSGLMKDIGVSVTQADTALKNFQISANESGKDLSDKIQEAKMLSDELELIYQSSNRVADRLEQLTDGAPKATSKATSSKSADRAEKKSVPKSQTKSTAKADREDKLGWIKKKITKTKSDDDEAGSVFAIRDPDLEKDLKETADNDDVWDGPDNIESDAERQLYKALKSRSN